MYGTHEQCFIKEVSEGTLLVGAHLLSQRGGEASTLFLLEMPWHGGLPGVVPAREPCLLIQLGALLPLAAEPDLLLLCC